jgi:hypothetical protein
MALVTVLGLLVAGAAVADPPADMTGTWSGSAPCEVLDNGEYTFEDFDEPNFLIVHDTANDTIRVSATGVIYEGTVQRLKGGPNDAEAVMEDCGGVAGSPEVVRFRHVVIDKSGAARLDGNSIFFNTSNNRYATCLWHFTRVSTDEPFVPPCGD